MSTEKLLFVVVYMYLKQFLDSPSVVLCLLFLFKAICLLPTYELALQTGQMAEKMGKFCPEVKIGYAVRGEKGKELPPASKFAIVVSKADLPSNVIYYNCCLFSVSRGQKVTDHILFGTPGTLLDWILRHRVIDPKKIRMCVFHAADVMIGLQGHQDQCRRLHKSVNFCYRARSIIWNQIFFKVYFQGLRPS